MKTYGQYCGLARALDHVGDRWTLLIVRELLLGPRRYSEIRAGLPGVATNLLAQRLRDLCSDGIVDRSDDGTYRLTDFGRELEQVIYPLVRWGGRWMVDRDDHDVFRPEWLVVALAALLPKRRSGRVEIHTEGSVISIDRGRVSNGAVESPDATVHAPAQVLLGIAAGMLPLSTAEIDGDRRIAASVLGGA